MLSVNHTPFLNWNCFFSMDIVSTSLSLLQNYKDARNAAAKIKDKTQKQKAREDGRKYYM